MGDKTRITKEKAGKYARKGQNRRAIREYEKLLVHKPEDGWTLHRLAELWAREGDKTKAVDFFIKVAEGHSREGFSDRAVSVFKQALTVDATRLEANLRLADEYMKKEFERDAVCHLLKAASVYEEKGMENEELEVLRRGVELVPGDVDCHMYLARVYVRMDQQEKAREEFLRAAMELREADRTDEFIKVAERAIQFGETSIELHHALAENYLQQRECEKAMKVLQHPMRVRSDDFRTMELSAQAHLGMDKPTQAAAVYKRLARIARSMGDTRRAEQAQDRLKEISPHSAMIRPPEPPPIPAGRARSPEEPEPSEPPLPEEAHPDLSEAWEDEDEEFTVDTHEEYETDQKTMMVAIDDFLSEADSAKRADQTNTDIDPETEEEIREGLDMADFFIGQGLLDEASEVLDDLAEEHSGHSEIEERLEEIQRLKRIALQEDTEDYQD